VAEIADATLQTAWITRMHLTVS